MRPWCLTPVLNAEENSPEFNFNTMFKKARCTIERCNGVLKGRFRCLIKDCVLHYKPNKATKIINACTVLHNICISNNLEEPELQDLNDEQLGIIPPVPCDIILGHTRVNPMLLRRREKQRNIIRNYFN